MSVTERHAESTEITLLRELVDIQEESLAGIKDIRGWIIISIIVIIVIAVLF